jgi:hypothetical protein
MDFTIGDIVALCVSGLVFVGTVALAPCPKKKPRRIVTRGAARTFHG